MNSKIKYLALGRSYCQWIVVGILLGSQTSIVTIGVMKIKTCHESFDRVRFASTYPLSVAAKCIQSDSLLTGQNSEISII